MRTRHEKQMKPAKHTKKELKERKDKAKEKKQERQEHVLVERERVLAIVVGVKVAAEPVREARVDGPDRLAVAPPRELGSATARVERDGDGKALVQRPRPQ